MIHFNKVSEVLIRSSNRHKGWLIELIMQELECFEIN